VLDSTTLNRIQWYPWTTLVDQELISLSWKHSTMIKINCQGPTDQSITFLNLLSTKLDVPSGLKSDVLEISFSPDGLYLLTRDENNLIQLWRTNSVTRVDLTGDDIGEVRSLSDIDYADDSSTIVIWERARSKVAVLATDTGRSKVIDLCCFPMKAATFCPSSKRILILDSYYQVTLLSLDDVTSTFLGTLPRYLSIIDILLLSPTAKSIVLIGRENNMRVISVFDYGMDPVYPLFHCSGLFRFLQEFPYKMTAKFTPDGAQLFILEESHGTVYSFSLIRMSSRPLQRFTIAEFNPVMSWGLLSLKTITIEGLQVLRATLRSYYGSVINLAFDCSGGRTVADPILHKEFDILYYGKHRLPTSKIVTGRTSEISEHHVAYINKNKQAVIINYSGYIDKM
jgi:WD40 repeat protein